MKTYTFTEAGEKLASLLARAAREGEVRIKRRGGQVFVIRLQKRSDSPLNTKGLNLKLRRKEILESIAEGRRGFQAARKIAGALWEERLATEGRQLNKLQATALDRFRN